MDRTASTTAKNFDITWLCRYPRPIRVHHDRGPEFMGDEFQEMLKSYGIKSKPITSKNPQANAICERVHLEIMNIVRAYGEEGDINEVIQYAAFSVRASYHSILAASPGQVLFGQDMITRRLYEANWSYICKRRFEAILHDNDRENESRLEHFYNIGDQVMLKIPKRERSKTMFVRQGPFPIKEIHSNGTVTLDKGRTTQVVSIRRIVPFI